MPSQSRTKRRSPQEDSSTSSKTGVLTFEDETLIHFRNSHPQVPKVVPSYAEKNVYAPEGPLWHGWAMIFAKLGDMIIAGASLGRHRTGTLKLCPPTLEFTSPWQKTSVVIQRIPKLWRVRMSLVASYGGGLAQKVMFCLVLTRRMAHVAPPVRRNDGSLLTSILPTRRLLKT